MDWRYRKQLVQRRENRLEEGWLEVGRLPFIVVSLRNAPYGHSFTVLRGCCYVFTAPFRVHAKETTTIPSCGAVCAFKLGSTSKENEREIISRPINFHRNIFLNVFYCTIYIYLETEFGLEENF